MRKLSKKYIDNVNIITSEFNNREDLVKREISVGKLHFCVFYIIGLCDAENVSKLVINPILKQTKLPKNNLLNTLQKEILVFSEISTSEDIDQLIGEILAGKAVLICDNCTSAITIQADKIKERAIAEPPTDAVIKGPRSGFVENYKTNLAAIKKIIKSVDLKTINLTVGRRTRTNVSVVYIDGIAADDVVQSIVSKIKGIDIDGVIDSYYIAQFLETRRASIFKQVGSTEKPDIACAKLLEGRVAIVVDGSPIVLTLPYLLFEDMQHSDDYYREKSHVSYFRMIRLISIFITAVLPGLYIAVELYHYKALPLKYLITLLNSTQNLPLTPLLELLFVLILFDILYEASLRMPRYLGQAMSIVGALILGDTAVKAGIISPPAVMIVALSSIALYVVPDQSAQFSITRILFVFAGGLLGFYGVLLGVLFIIFYFNDFDAYGTPYLAPLAPRVDSDLKDFLTKSDLTKMKTRPKSIPNQNHRRMK